MGGGSWSHKDFVTYSTSVGRSVATDGSLSGKYSNQDIFKSRNLHEDLDPYEVTRECCDSNEHPNTIPVILALDVTGSMGQAAVEVAKKLNVVMTDLYKEVKDVEFMIMGIGDFYCDASPLQVSQFESDIRIAEQLDKVWFEFGGGGNDYESYTAAWYFASRHCNLDCWKRGKKGIIITIGDETLNPYLQSAKIQRCIGDNLQSDVDTKLLYEETKSKYDVYHIHVDHSNYSYHSWEHCGPTFKKVLGDEYVINSNLNNIAEKITELIVNTAKNQDSFNITVPVTSTSVTKNENGEITW